MSQAMITIVPRLGESRAAPRILDRAVSAAATVLAQARREWGLRQDRHLLAELDDRALSDIGIGRSQIESAVRHGRSVLSGTATRPLARGAAPLMPASWTEWR